MPLLEKLIKSNYFIVAYDFDSDAQGNMERNATRAELVHKFKAKMYTQSVYIVIDTMATREALERWASSQRADIVVFGADLDDKGQRRFAKGYLRYLKDLIREMRDIANIVRKDLIDFEEDMTPKSSLKGWHNKIAGMTNRFEDLQKAINKVGDEEDELDLQMLSAYVERISERYDRVRLIKEKLNK